MLDNTISITYNAVSKTLSRIKDDGYSSDYYLDDGTEKYSLSVKHTIPSRGEPGESHLVRLDVEHYDGTGEFLRTSSAWTVVKTFDGVQDTVAGNRTANALIGLLDTTFVAKILNRES